MRLRNNEIAACLVIALGVGSVLTGALLQEISTGKTAQQPESVAAAAYVEPTPAPETTPEPMPTVKIWSVTSRSQIRRKMRICVEPMPFPDAAALPMSLL